MNRTFRSLLGAGLLAFASVGTQAAVVSVIVESGIQADGLIDWGVLGPSVSIVPQPFTIAVPGVPGLDVTVSQPGDTPFERRDQGPAWLGNFAPGEELLFTGLIDDTVTLDFDSAVQGVGFQIQSNAFGVFTARLEAFDAGNVSLGFGIFSGNSDSAANDSAIFAGLLSTSVDIDRIVIDITLNGGSGFAINGPRIQVPGIPEPTTLALLALALAGLGFGSRLRDRSRA